MGITYKYNTMRRFDQKYNTEYYAGDNNTDELYNLAYKRVKRIKGFYIHLAVYIIVNGFSIFTKLNHNWDTDKDLTELQDFDTMFYWGIGLFFHGLSVFGSNLFFGSKWEEKKMKEFMEKEKNNKWE